MSANIKNTPWRYTGSSTTTASWVEDAAGKRICTLKPGEHDNDHGILLALAPDLLHIAQELVRMSHAGLAVNEKLYKKARATISRITQ